MSQRGEDCSEAVPVDSEVGSSGSYVWMGDDLAVSVGAGPRVSRPGIDEVSGEAELSECWERLRCKGVFDGLQGISGEWSAESQGKSPRKTSPPL